MPSGVPSTLVKDKERLITLRTTQRRKLESKNIGRKLKLLKCNDKEK
jgi:hypothetical protein